MTANAPSCRLRQARCSACPTQGWVVSHEPWSAASRLSRDRRSCWFCIDKNRKAYTEMTKSPGAHRDEVSAGAFLVSGSIQGIRPLFVPQVFFQRPHGSCQNFKFPMGAIRQDLRHFSFKTGPCAFYAVAEYIVNGNAKRIGDINQSRQTELCRSTLYMRDVGWLLI